MSSPKELYAVIGHPIKHSKSPEIHQQFAKKANREIEYRTIDCPVDQFEKVVRDFQQEGGKGLSVTIPFKHQAYALADEHSAYAKLVKAANTLRFINNKIIADNTDGIGLVRDLQHHKITLQDSRLLILGAGGACRGIVPALLKQKVSSIVIANRTLSNADSITDDFKGLGEIVAVNYENIPKQQYDLIINATSLSLIEQVPPINSRFIDSDTVCYDLAYVDGDTAFQLFAKQQQAKKALNGKGMLYYQAQAAFWDDGF